MLTDQKEDLFDLDELSKDGLGQMPDPFFKDEPEVEGQKYVLFQLGEEYFGIMSDRVSEVVRMLPLTQIPNVAEWFRGIANLRGDILSVIELSTLWGREKTEYNAKEKLIVLRSQSSETHLAIRVDRLREIITIPDDALEYPQEQIEHVYATAEHKGMLVNLVNPTSLLTNLKLR